MKKLGQIILGAAVGGALLVPAAIAQTAPQQSSPQSSSDQMQGVSSPPSDDTITASPDAPPPVAKPSAAVPAQPVPAQPAPAPAPAAATPSAPPENGDYGVVSSVPAQGNTAMAAPNDMTLQKRPWNPDDDIVSMVPSPSNELAEGTNIRVKITEQLSTDQTQNGQPFKGVVTADVYKEGRIIIPTGSELRGRVVGVTQGHHLGPHATLRLRPDMVMLPDGTAYHLYAQVVGTQAPHTRTDSEGGIQPSSDLKKNAVEYGAGVGAGVVVGAKVAGPHGAVVGGLVGAGVVTAHLLIQHPRSAVVPEGSMITFSLTEPMALTPTRN